MFSVSHYLLAVKYQAIAKHIPMLIDKEEAVVRNPRTEAIVFWLVLSMNILFPALEIYSIIAFNTEVLLNG